MEDIKTSNAFFRFLGVGDGLLPSSSAGQQFTFDGFVGAANAMAKSMKDEHFAIMELLVFKSTGDTSHGGHVTDTECRPDYTAAFESHWNRNHTLWPCIRLAGEKASKGKSVADQEKQAISYLHYLLLARPDLHVAQGLLTFKSKVMFLFGIGGCGIRSFTVAWDDPLLYKLMYAFVYRLYDSGQFSDSSYEKMVPDLKNKFVTYTMRVRPGSNGDEEIQVSDFCPTYGSNPFGTRTHILINRRSKFKVNGEPFTVIKDQLCRIGTRFEEHSILAQVHEPDKVPGVVEPVFHEIIDVSTCESRKKHRMGLRQVGRPFATIPTLQQALKITFDILEVLQYLRFKRSILHRDISKGNVLYFDDDLLSSTGDTLHAQSDGAKDICFINYLLDESPNPRETLALLIDFNHAEHLASKRGPEHKQTTITGTPVFIARAIQLGHPVELQDTAVLTRVPASPEVYASNHPDRVSKFPDRPWSLISHSDKPSDGWRHELDHDTESVFWLLLYWAIGAQPDGLPEEPIEPHIWAGLVGPVRSRLHLVAAGLNGATHSAYKPLWSLLNNLAAILRVDRHWLERSDPRNDPGYLNEAFQRLILQFLLDNRGKEFMTRPIKCHPRQAEKISENLSLSHTSLIDHIQLNPSLKRKRDTDDVEEQ